MKDHQAVVGLELRTFCFLVELRGCSDGIVVRAVQCKYPDCWFDSNTHLCLWYVSLGSGKDTEAN